MSSLLVVCIVFGLLLAWTQSLVLWLHRRVAQLEQEMADIKRRTLT